MAGPSGAVPSVRNCVSCGRSIAWDANVCPYCGHDFRMMAQPVAAKKESAMPVIGGILILLAGLVEIGYGALMVVGGASSAFLIGDIGGAIAICGAVAILVGLVVIIGGIFAIQRRNFAFAIVAGILSLGGFFILGLIGLILVVVAKDEFR